MTPSPASIVSEASRAVGELGDHVASVTPLPRPCAVCIGEGMVECFTCGGSGDAPTHRRKTAVDEAREVIEKARDLLRADPDAVPFVLEQFDHFLDTPF